MVVFVLLHPGQVSNYKEYPVQCQPCWHKVIKVFVPKITRMQGLNFSYLLRNQSRLPVWKLVKLDLMYGLHREWDAGGPLLFARLFAWNKWNWICWSEVPHQANVPTIVWRTRMYREKGWVCLVLHVTMMILSEYCSSSTYSCRHAFSINPIGGCAELNLGKGSARPHIVQNNFWCQFGPLRLPNMQMSMLILLVIGSLSKCYLPFSPAGL